MPKQNKFRSVTAVAIIFAAALILYIQIQGQPQDEHVDSQYSICTRVIAKLEGEVAGKDGIQKSQIRGVQFEDTGEKMIRNPLAIPFINGDFYQVTIAYSVNEIPHVVEATPCVQGNYFLPDSLPQADTLLRQPSVPRTFFENSAPQFPKPSAFA